MTPTARKTEITTYRFSPIKTKNMETLEKLRSCVMSGNGVSSQIKRDDDNIIRLVNYGSIHMKMHIASKQTVSIIYIDEEYYLLNEYESKIVHGGIGNGLSISWSSIFGQNDDYFSEFMNYKTDGWALITPSKKFYNTYMTDNFFEGMYFEYNNSIVCNDLADAMKAKLCSD